MSSWLYSHLTMGCGVSTFHCMDGVGLVKPRPPEDRGRSDNAMVVGNDAVSTQTMVSDETGETCSLNSSASSGCQSKVACITIHNAKEIETEKSREICLVDKTIIKSEDKRRNEIAGDTTMEARIVDGDSEEEEEPWWRKGDTNFMRSPSFRDYCIIHYSSGDEDGNEDARNERTSNERNVRSGKEKTKALDSNKKKSRGKVAKRKPKGKKVLHKESSGSLRNILNVAACYSQPHSSKSPR